MKIVVSACLLGENCKYSGGNNYHAGVAAFVRDHEAIPVCPEVMGGLPVPRAPAEIVNGRVQNADGTDVDDAFRRGAALALAKALHAGATHAILQPRSPSCGATLVYDGSFSGRLIAGCGVFARRLLDAGIRVTEASEYALDGESEHGGESAG